MQTAVVPPIGAHHGNLQKNHGKISAIGKTAQTMNPLASAHAKRKKFTLVQQEVVNQRYSFRRLFFKQ